MQWPFCTETFYVYIWLPVRRADPSASRWNPLRRIDPGELVAYSVDPVEFEVHPTVDASESEFVG